MDQAGYQYPPQAQPHGMPPGAVPAPHQQPYYSAGPQYAPQAPAPQAPVSYAYTVPPQQYGPPPGQPAYYAQPAPPPPPPQYGAPTKIQVSCDRSRVATRPINRHHGSSKPSILHRPFFCGHSPWRRTRCRPPAAGRPSTRPRRARRRSRGPSPLTRYVPCARHEKTNAKSAQGWTDLRE